MTIYKFSALLFYIEGRTIPDDPNTHYFMKNKQLGITSIREMFKNMSLSDRNEVINSFNQEKDKLGKVEERRTTFIQLVKDWGYTSPTDFLIEGEFIPNPTVKRPRTVITDDLHQNISNDLKVGTMTSREISEKHKVTESSVDTIKRKMGLTKPRKPKVTTTVPTTLEVAA